MLDLSITLRTQLCAKYTALCKLTRQTLVIAVKSIRFIEEYVEIALDKKYKYFIYRGHSQGYYRLETSIRRAFATLKIREAWRNGREREVNKAFKDRAHLYLSHFPAQNDDLEWLSVMQHYGAPTRLLDWSYSPFVAAFFAFQQLAKGCCVYEIDLTNLNRANTFRLPDAWKADFPNGTENYVVPYSPNYQNERLILQQGLFLVPGNIQCDVEQIVEEYEGHERFIIKYQFNLSPHDITRAINKLKAMNIDNSHLFPGIDGLSKSMYLELLDPKRQF